MAKLVNNEGSKRIGGLTIYYDYGVCDNPKIDLTFSEAIGFNSSIVWEYDSNLNFLGSRSWSSLNIPQTIVNKLISLRNIAFEPDYGPYVLENIGLKNKINFDTSISGTTVKIDFKGTVNGCAFTERRPSPYSNYEYKELSFTKSNNIDISLIQVALAFAAAICLAFIIKLVLSGALSAAVLTAAVEACYAIAF